METKECSSCKKELTLNKFSKDSRYAKGVKGQCRACIQEMSNKRYHAAPEKYRKKYNDWNNSHTELREQRYVKAYIKYLEKRGYTVSVG